jgi:hypothetical protein
MVEEKAILLESKRPVLEAGTKKVNRGKNLTSLK